MAFSDDILFASVMFKRQFDYIYAEKVKPYQITFIQAIYMKAILDTEGEVTMTRLASLFGVTRARVTIVLKGVRAAGYLVETPIDGRTISLSLTEEGKEVVVALNRMVKEDTECIFADFTEEELNIAVRSLEAVNKRLQEKYPV